MLSTAGQVFSWLKRKVEKTTAHYLGHDHDLQDGDLDSDLIIRQVNHLTKTLMFDGGLTAEEKEDIVCRIGHMAYMGAPEVGRTAGTCLNEMVTLLKNRRTSQSLKEKLIMSISEICYLNRDNQNRSTSALPCLVDIMGKTEEDIHMSRLACYCISCIVCDNYSAMQELSGLPNLKESLYNCLSVERPWLGWSDNFAILLVDILSLSNDMNRLGVRSILKIT